MSAPGMVADHLAYGGLEEIVVRGESREALDAFVALNRLQQHPRLKELKITGEASIEISEVTS